MIAVFFLFPASTFYELSVFVSCECICISRKRERKKSQLFLPCGQRSALLRPETDRQGPSYNRDQCKRCLIRPQTRAGTGKLSDWICGERMKVLNIWRVTECRPSLFMFFFYKRERRTLGLLYLTFEDTCRSSIQLLDSIHV